MAECDALVVVSQSAVLFGLVAIAAVGFGLGRKGLSFGLLSGFCMLTDWAAFFPRKRVHAVLLCYGAENAGRCDGQRSALRWAMQRAATALAAHCGI